MVIAPGPIRRNPFVPVSALPSCVLLSVGSATLQPLRNVFLYPRVFRFVYSSSKRSAFSGASPSVLRGGVIGGCAGGTAMATPLVPT